jgi:hypothetical protein
MTDQQTFNSAYALAAAQDENRKLLNDLAQARETNRRLNARCQLAEKALKQMLSPVRRGGSMARAFLAWHNRDLMEEVKVLTAERDEWKALAGGFDGVKQECPDCV